MVLEPLATMTTFNIAQDITTVADDEWAYELTAMDGDELTVDADLKTLGASAYGIFVDGPNVRVYLNGTIETEGLASSGIYFLGESSAGSQPIEQQVIIAPEGGITTLHAPAIDLHGANLHYLSLTNTGSITTDEDHLVIVGGARGDIIYNDGQITGMIALGNGNDVLENDGTIVGAIILGGGADFFDGSEGTHAAVIGEEGADVLRGSAEADTLDGGADGDMLDGNGGADVLTGGTGNDTYIVDDPSDYLIEQKAEGTDEVWVAGTFYIAGTHIEIIRIIGDGATIIAGDAAIFVFGGAGNDTLYGGGGADRLEGGDGNDAIHGGGESDYMVGGAGNDTFSVNAFDHVDEAAGGGNDVVVVLGADFSAEPFSTEAASELEILIAGTSFDTLIIGNDYAQTIRGKAGNDTLSGRAGNDIVDGDLGDDWLGGGDDTDTLRGGAGSDLLWAGHGRDLLYGGAGTDMLYGEGGTDRLEGGAHGDKLYGGDGADRLFGQDGNDQVFGLMSNDKLYGGAGNDYLVGGSGTDTLAGHLGNDTLSAGPGLDILMGGTGKDAFVLEAKVVKGQAAQVKDFNVRDDSVWLESAVFKGIGSGTAKKPGKLKADAFWLGDKAHDADDRILYNPKTGILSYDADGTGQAAAVEIAKLAKKLKMTHADFFVI